MQQGSPKPTEHELDKVAAGGKLKENDSGGDSLTSLLWLAVSAFALTVGSTIGTGILAVPVKAGMAGGGPFLVTFILVTVFNCLAVLYTIELLQRTQAIQTLKVDDINAVLEERQESDIDSENSDQNVVMLDEKKVKKVSELSSDLSGNVLMAPGPDMHSMSYMFLHPIAAFACEISILVQLISLLISYALAGALSIAQLVGKDPYYIYMIAPYVIILTLVLVLGHFIIKQIVTLLTIIKGLLLVVLIGVAIFVGKQINETWSDNWQFIGKPFLISTVTMGGMVNILPIIYSKIKPSRLNIFVLQTSCISALIICALLVIMWVYAILLSVPVKPPVPGAVSLEKSYENGEISTVPFIAIIEYHFPSYRWAGIVANCFIATSITVSFLAIGSALKHMLDGYAKSFMLAVHNPKSFLMTNQTLKKIVKSIYHPELMVQLICYFICFFFIYIVAQANPRKFFDIIEIFSSLGINVETGIFITAMLFISRTKKHSEGISIASPLPGIIVHTLWFTASFFILAIIYDIIVVVWGFFTKDVPI